MSLQLRYTYAPFWRALDDDSELERCGLPGLVDGQVDRLPSHIDLGLDHTARVAQLMQHMLVHTKVVSLYSFFLF